MGDKNEMRQKFEKFRPSKTLWFWSCAGSVALTVVLGFTVGGWVTGGTAQQMAQAGREDGRAQLAASICVERFASSPEFAVNLAALKEESSWAQDRFLAEAGWVTPVGMEEPIDGAGELCAEQLVEMEATAAAPAEEAGVEETAADATKS
ncbi:MAG: hypothetical protein WD341_10430 [Tistlia sp.]|uniref:hypothetical protein n=1 Tax=Tistlia sp. TaxID=3057121 RepID=UPI0034A41B9A